MTNKYIKFVLFAIFISFLSGCSRHTENHAQGYMEGRYTYMATSVSGVLKQLFVARGDFVKQGQKLFVLEEEPESDIYQAAQESLKQAINARDATAANLEYAKLTFERYKVLVPKKAIQQSQLDNAEAVYNATSAQLSEANAKIAEAKATLAQSKWTAQQKTIYAPLNALVFDTYYRIGEYTVANQSILSLLVPGDIKAIFYVPEADLGSIKLNDHVSVECDGCNQTYTGRVSFISPTAEYTPPVIFSTETSAKLIFRIEAEFKAEDAIHLHPGQPVRVTYYPHE